MARKKEDKTRRMYYRPLPQCGAWHKVVAFQRVAWSWMERRIRYKHGIRVCTRLIVVDVSRELVWSISSMLDSNRD